MKCLLFWSTCSGDLMTVTPTARLLPLCRPRLRSDCQVGWMHRAERGRPHPAPAPTPPRPHPVSRRPREGPHHCFSSQHPRSPCPHLSTHAPTFPPTPPALQEPRAAPASQGSQRAVTANGSAGKPVPPLGLRLTQRPVFSQQQTKLVAENLKEEPREEGGKDQAT